MYQREEREAEIVMVEKVMREVWVAICPFCKEEINSHESDYHHSPYACDERPEPIFRFDDGVMGYTEVFEHDGQWWMIRFDREHDCTNSGTLIRWSIKRYRAATNKIDQERAKLVARIAKIDAFYKTCDSVGGKTADQLFK